MSLVSLLINGATLRAPPDWFSEALGGTTTEAGVKINETTAWNLSAVYACIRNISESVGSLPFNVYKRKDRGKEKLTDHNVYRMLHDQPNEDMTAMVFRETMQANVLTWGNAYAEIQRNGIGKPIALWPMMPNRTKVMRNDAGKIIYEYKTDDNRFVTIPSSNVFHIPGMGFNGLVGQSIIRLARESLGLTLASEEFGSRFFGNGSRPTGVLEHPNKLSPDAAIGLRKAWDESTSGSNQLRTVVLEQGLTWKPMSIPPDDAQFLETRRFQVEEIARWYNVPPHKIKHLDKSTFNNIEHQGIEYVVDTMRPWLVRWEQEVKRKLFGINEKDIFGEHLVDGLLRGDAKSRNEAYSIRFNNGSLSPNDIRELENENPIEGGDIYLVPMNMMTVEKAAKEPEPPPEPAPPAEPAPDEQAAAILQDTIKRIATKEAKVVEKIIKSKSVDYFDKFIESHGNFIANALHIGFDLADELTALAKARMTATTIDGIDNYIDLRIDEINEVLNEKTMV